MSATHSYTSTFLTQIEVPISNPARTQEVPISIAASGIPLGIFLPIIIVQKYSFKSIVSPISCCGQPWKTVENACGIVRYAEPMVGSSKSQVTSRHVENKSGLQKIQT